MFLKEPKLESMSLASQDISIMDKLRCGWFSEVNQLWPGQCLSLEVDEVCHKSKSKYQDVLVFKSKNHGMVLCLDDVIQCTESDEFAYQEMISHLPLFSHPNPENVLVVGGGDGGVVREVAKHESVKHITLCEIDEEVINVSKKYLPTMAQGFASEKVSIHVGDGFDFLSKHKNEFDVIITDSSDPVGPAEVLFEKPYYELLHSALKLDGILCSQAESVWLKRELDLILKMKIFCRGIFPVVEYAYCTIPTYPSGQIGFLLCSKTPDAVLTKPLRVLADKDLAVMQLKYYNFNIHQAAFALPQFAHEVLNI